MLLKHGGVPLKLNIGSGQRPFRRPFINVDCQAKWKPDVVADGAHMPMFGDGTAEIIVLHHVLEHFGCGEAKPLIEECHRILAPRGCVIITVPNMKRLAEEWALGFITDQIYFTNMYGAYMSDEADRHKWGYSERSLFLFLNSCARWRNIFPFDFRHTIEGADIAEDWWILGMEAVK